MSLVSLGIMSLLPHPVNSYANMLWIKGDMPALEIARRLFPIRTGVPVPDWIVIESRMDRIGAAGISAAGLGIVALSVVVCTDAPPIAYGATVGSGMTGGVCINRILDRDGIQLCI